MRWIVAVPPGSTNDLISRLVATKLAESVGQPVLVDNRPGGAFVIASEIIARAAPDGHTVGTLLTPHVVNPFVMKNLPYDTLRDFTPVSNMAIVPGVLTVHPSVPANTLKALIACAKSRPGALNYGVPGQLTSGHLSVEMLKVTAGIDVTYIPYKGGAPAIADLIAGQIQMLISGPPGVLQHIKRTTEGDRHRCGQTLARHAGYAYLRRGRSCRIRHLRVVRGVRAGKDSEGRARPARAGGRADRQAA